MSQRAVVALDVGGTDVRTACISQDRTLIGEVLESASPSAGRKEEIVAELARAVVAARAQAPGYTVTGCAIAIPAPFDYAAGVSHMEHKFQAINGLSLGGLLRELTGLPTSFLNDADAFGLGVSWRQLPQLDRFVGLTIGTGLGATFMEHGRTVRTGDKVPPEGEVWNLPYGDGILEDYVSGRAVVAAYQRLSTTEAHAPSDANPVGVNSVDAHLLVGRNPVGAHGPTAKDVAGLALRGSGAAVRAYRAMGTALGRGLAPILLRFQPEALVIGGKIVKALSTFGPAISQALAGEGLPELPVIGAVDDTMALWGAAKHLLAAD